jgi:hypothetical protein
VQNNFFCRSPKLNIYEFPSINSKISSQILYGEKYKILLKKKNFLKIKTSFDNYIGLIKISNQVKKFKPTYKICALKSIILKYPGNSKKYKSNNFLPFGSKIQILKKNKNFIMFEKTSG